jgi:glutamate racemase
MSDNCKPIGFFDSGIGGISVLKTAYQLMPHENYIYYGDNLNAPYGEKSEEAIKQLSLAAGDFLFQKGVKAIVMACNTATSTSVIIMREKFNIPVLSMEPAVKPALSALQGGKVLVLATSATVSQPRYLSLLKKLVAEEHVISVGCSGLVELIEDEKINEADIHKYLRLKLAPYRNEAIDAVVLGCTHYAFIEPHINSYFVQFGLDIPIFDGRFGTARHLKHVLESHNMRCTQNNNGRIEFFSSGQAYDAKRFAELFQVF